MKKVLDVGMRRVAGVALVVSLTVMAAAGAAFASPAAKKAAPLTIGLPGVPPVFMAVRSETALQKGFYKKYGANVELKLFQTGTDAVKAVQAGQIDAAWSPTPFTLSLIAKGTPLVAIEGLDVVDWVLLSSDSSITTCPQLKGQTISIDAVGGARYGALQAMLRKCNLTVDDVKVVSLPGDAAVQAMLAGQIKLGVYHMDEQAEMDQKLKSPTKTVIALTDVDPYQHYDMLVTTKDNLKAKYNQFVKALAGDIAATPYMYNPKNLQTVAKIATVTGRDQATAAAAIKKYAAIKWWPLNASGLGIGKITRTIGLNVKLGNIPPSANLKWADVVDTKPWKAAYKLVQKSQKPKAVKKKK
jgi:NitT/TauT family transport system substrate-binding protein